MYYDIDLLYPTFREENTNDLFRLENGYFYGNLKVLFMSMDAMRLLDNNPGFAINPYAEECGVLRTNSEENQVVAV